MYHIRTRQLRCEIGVNLWLYGWINSADSFRAETALAEGLGAVELLLWESNYIGLPPEKADVVEAMRGYVAR